MKWKGLDDLPRGIDDGRSSCARRHKTRPSRYDIFVDKIQRLTFYLLDYLTGHFQFLETILYIQAIIMDAHNAVLEKTTLPLVEEEEHEDVVATVSALEDPESLASSAMANEPTKSTSDDGTKNIFYVNFNPNTDTLAPTLRQQLLAVQGDVALNAQFMDKKANDAVDAKLKSGALKDDPNDRAIYKAKVINYLATTVPWYVYPF